MEKKTKIVSRLARGLAPALLVLAIILSATAARAETYGPVSFLLPPEWECTIEKSSDVCLNPTERSSIALVVTYKLKTAQDTLDYYKNQLSAPRPLKTSSGTTMSQVKLVHEIQLNGQTWLEALHLNSEIRGFYTDYLVTIAGSYAVLISITVKDTLYPTGLINLKPTVDSLKITVPQSAPAQSTGQSAPPQTQQSATPLRQNLRGQSRTRRLHIYLIAGFVAAVFLLIYAIMK